MAALRTLQEHVHASPSLVTEWLANSPFKETSGLCYETRGKECELCSSRRSQPSHFLACPVARSRALGEAEKGLLGDLSSCHLLGGRRAAGGPGLSRLQGRGRPLRRAGGSLCRAGRQHLRALGCQEKCTHPQAAGRGLSHMMARIWPLPEHRPALPELLLARDLGRASRAEPRFSHLPPGNGIPAPSSCR